LLQAFLSAPDPSMNSDPRSDPCFGWGAYASSHELVHYKHVAAAAASLLKDSFDKCAAFTLSDAYFALEFTDFAVFRCRCPQAAL
jgi:hypothetical protein